MFDYDLSPLDQRLCQWAHDYVEENDKATYKAIVAEVEAGKDIFWIRTLMQNRLADHEKTAHCASTARWLYYQKQLDQLAEQADRPQRRRRRGRR